MCYDIKVLHETALKRARRKNDAELMSIIEKELEGYDKIGFHHVSGYTHPKIPIYTSENQYIPKLKHWGLIPFWAKDEQTAISLKNKTLNARFETIFEKPAFRASAKNKRCLIYVDGFFEHHHFKGKTYPCFIHSKKPEPICLAGLWDEWVNIDSGEIYNGFSIVTTKGKGIMKQIHNNPKLSEPRMPLILSLEEEENWLNMDFNKEKLQQIRFDSSENNLKAYTVQRLRGKSSLGNVPEACEEYNYSELI
ncbi:MAG: SOS response-associated peptidase [Bacteroidales bacterium]|jgi:putative SOS response-associated peptidase YedK|nr:SOS response-associated peptidase [Bacteroidales bacterium]